MDTRRRYRRRGGSLRAPIAWKRADASVVRGIPVQRFEFQQRDVQHGRCAVTGNASVKIATWNVNSIKARLQAAREWLAETGPDVVCMQEIKCVDDAFPRLEFEEMGYNCAVHG